jgi:hypothetical protein
MEPVIHFNSQDSHLESAQSADADRAYVPRVTDGTRDRRSDNALRLDAGGEPVARMAGFAVRPRDHSPARVTRFLDAINRRRRLLGETIEPACPTARRRVSAIQARMRRVPRR